MIVFIDGIYSSYLSETTHDGVDICLMSAALTKPMYRPIIEVYFNKAASRDDSMTSLNTAFTREGAFIHIPKNKAPRKPVEILHFSTGNESALMLQPRNLIIAEENSELQVIERHRHALDLFPDQQLCDGNLRGKRCHRRLLQGPE